MDLAYDAAMNAAYADIFVRLGLSLLVGGVIGLERSYNGRPAGFRTHTLVCLSSAVLMLLTAYESLWFVPRETARIVLDPTRMAQGIMTGIGFLGAGVIVKEGASVRGLTTAASIWITAALGILAGVGFYLPVAAGTIATLGTLSLFRWIENRVPATNYASLVIRYPAEQPALEEEVRTMVTGFGFRVSRFSYRMNRPEGYFEYQMVIQSREADNWRGLAQTLTAASGVRTFRITPVGD